jgi:hypothetical protein
MQHPSLLPQRFLQHPLLYLEILEGKLFCQIDEAITEAFFGVDPLLGATLLSTLNVLHCYSGRS